MRGLILAVGLILGISVLLFVSPSAQAQPTLFVSASPGDGSVGTVSSFDLSQQTPTGQQIATNLPGLANSIACGPDGKLYLAFSGYGCCSPARQIIRMDQNGKNQQLVIDFSQSSVLQNSGGPDGLAFGSDGSLFFNTVFSEQRFQATGVWKLPDATSQNPGTPAQVITSFTDAGGSGGTTAFLIAPPYAGSLIAAEHLAGSSTYATRIVRVPPPFDAPQSPIDFITGFTVPHGLAVDNSGNVYVSGGPGSNGALSEYSSDGAFMKSIPPSASGGLGAMAFDSAGNLYVAFRPSTGSGPSVMRIAADGTQSFFGDASAFPAAGVDVCPRPRMIVGLGDSVAAGYGLDPADSGPSSYPMLFGDEWGVAHGYRVLNFAQSGAVSGSSNCPSKKTGCKNVLTQIDSVQGGIPEVVTLTVGADDINFAKCFEQLILNGKIQGNECSRSGKLARRLANLHANLESIYSKLHTLNPKIRIYETQYYNPLSKSQGDPRSCPPSLVGAGIRWRKLRRGVPLISTDFDKWAIATQNIDYGFVASILNRLNRQILLAAEHYPYVSVISPLSDFAGHDACSSDPKLFSPAAGLDFYGLPIVFPDTAQLCPFGPADENIPFGSFDFRPLGVDLYGKIGRNCFPHPNAEGQQSLADEMCKAVDPTLDHCP